MKIKLVWKFQTKIKIELQHIHHSLHPHRQLEIGKELSLLLAFHTFNATLLQYRVSFRGLAIKKQITEFEFVCNLWIWKALNELLKWLGKKYANFH